MERDLEGRPHPTGPDETCTVSDVTWTTKGVPMVNAQQEEIDTVYVWVKA